MKEQKCPICDVDMGTPEPLLSHLLTSHLISHLIVDTDNFNRRIICLCGYKMQMIHLHTHKLWQTFLIHMTGGEVYNNQFTTLRGIELAVMHYHDALNGVKR